MTEKLKNKELTHYLTACIEVWHNQHKEVTCMQVLNALEEIRYKLTEALIDARQR